MAVTGTRPETIQAVILAGLVAQTITAGDFSIVLNQAEDDIDPTVGAHEMRDGGVVVLYRGGQSDGMRIQQSTGGRIQRRWTQSYLVRVSYSVAGAGGQELASTTANLGSQIVNLIEAALEPQSGSLYPIVSIALRTPIRHPSQRGYYLQEADVSVSAFWSR